MKNIKLIPIVIAAVIFTGLIFGGCARDVVGSSPGSLPSAPSSVSEYSPATTTPSSAGPYATEIVPMTTAECGRCHVSIYNSIKTEGTKHQLECAKCHEQFHIYRPGKVEYDQILPQCAGCHQEPHGKEIIKCYECHAEVHTPAKITAGPIINESCVKCHNKERKQLKANPSKHTELDCFFCHSEHRYIPECMGCHESHTKEMVEADCHTCHPAHMPLQITYSADAPQTECSFCHKKAYDDLQARNTKHTALTCAKCHPRHRQIPQCESCHGKPHKAAIHKAYSQCGECHDIAHSLPIAEEN